MGKMFVDTTRCAERDDQGNVIYFRRKMDLGTEADVQSAAMIITYDGEGSPHLAMDAGKRTKAMMQLNILGWEGPDFCDAQGRTIPCTPETILLLDTDQPLIKRVQARIEAANTAPQEFDQHPDPKAVSATPSGSVSSGDSVLPIPTNGQRESIPA